MSEDVFRLFVVIGVALAAISCIWQAAVLTILLVAGKKAQKAAEKAMHAAEGRFGPLVKRVETIAANTEKILEENRPQIAQVTKEAVTIAKAAREHAQRIGELIDETNSRAKARIAQIDETVGNTVDQVEHATGAVKEAVMKPVKEVNGLMAGVKAAISTYTQGGRRNSPENVTQDEEMFI